MLLSLATNDRGDERIVVLPFGSVVTYFTPSPTGQLELLVEPGAIAFPDEFERHREGVRAAVLAEAARRLGVAESEVLCQTMHRRNQIAPTTRPVRLTPKPPRRQTCRITCTAWGWRRGTSLIAV